MCHSFLHQGLTDLSLCLVLVLFTDLVMSRGQNRWKSSLCGHPCLIQRKYNMSISETECWGDKNEAKNTTRVRELCNSQFICTLCPVWLQHQWQKWIGFNSPAKATYPTTTAAWLWPRFSIFSVKPCGETLSLSTLPAAEQLCHRVWCLWAVAGDFGSTQGMHKRTVSKQNL